MTADFLARQERFDSVGSTNDVVRGWLDAGTPEVCLAVADEQTAGRGRAGRTWTAPPGAALLQSLGFRPGWLAPELAWRIPATVSLAMADAAEEVAGLPDGMVRLKWPNDLVVESSGERLVEAAASPSEGSGPTDRSTVLKLAGVLGETDGLGTADPRVIVGIGINADWPERDFPPALVGSMTSLREASNGRPIDRALLLDGFLSRLEVRIEALRAGRFDVADWTARQLTTGRLVRIEAPDTTDETVLALGVDARSGALVVEDATAPEGERQVHAGEVRHVRLARPDVSMSTASGTGV